MKKNKMSNTRGLRAGGYSILLSVIVIAVVVVLNLLVARLPADLTKPETAGIKLYDFDEQTRRVAESVDESVTVYVWSAKADADETIAEFLVRYAALNAKITVKYMDPALNPTFMDRYLEEGEEASAGCLVIESAKRFRVIDTTEIYTYSYTNEELQYYYYMYGTLPSPDVFDAENAITTAMDYVTTDVLPKVYQLTGHGETSLGSKLLSQLDAENFDVSDLALLTEEAVPFDCDLLVIGAPTQDLSDEELEMILTYIESGGDVLLFTLFDIVDLENFDTLCAAYGMRAEEGLILETTQAYYRYPYFLVANIELHTITEPLINTGSYVIAPFAHGIRELEAHRDTVKVAPLLRSTDDSYIKSLEFLNNLSTDTTLEPTDADAKGPFMVAATASETIDGRTGSLTWISAAELMTDDAIAILGNLDFVMNTIGNFCDKESTISVRSVSLGMEPLVVSESEANFWSITMMIGVPVVTVLIGFVLWLRRRKR